MEPTQSLEIPAGTTFGYTTGPWWRRQKNPVVTCADTLRLGRGFHVFAAPNGSGKTTLLRTLAGLLPLLDGGIAIRSEVHYYADALAFDPDISAARLMRALLDAKRLDRARELAEKLKLDWNRPFGRLSRGNRQKVSLILAEARLGGVGGGLVVLQDEPLAGLDLWARHTMLDLWEQTPPEITRIVVIHEFEEALRRASSLLSIRGGQLIQEMDAGNRTWEEVYQKLHA